MGNLYYYFFKKVGNLYYYFKKNKKESITTLSYNALGIRKRDCSRPTLKISAICRLKPKTNNQGFRWSLPLPLLKVFQKHYN